MTYVFDSSAVLAMILNEPGGDEAFELLPTSEISIVNLCEVYTKLAERGVATAAAEPLVMRFKLRVRSFRDAHALRAAELRPLTMHRGLSLGDRACLAQGTISGRPVLTGDRMWADLDVGVDIRFIR